MLIIWVINHSAVAKIGKHSHKVEKVVSKVGSMTINGNVFYCLPNTEKIFKVCKVYEFNLILSTLNRIPTRGQ